MTLNPNPEMNGIEMIAAERTRQIKEEGWSLAHDATEHKDDGALICAAHCYLLHAMESGWVYDKIGAEEYRRVGPDDLWPDGWRWNPKSPAEDLVRAAALIAADLDRRETIKEENSEN